MKHTAPETESILRLDQVGRAAAQRHIEEGDHGRAVYVKLRQDPEHERLLREMFPEEWEEFNAS